MEITLPILVCSSCFYEEPFQESVIAYKQICTMNQRFYWAISVFTSRLDHKFNLRNFFLVGAGADVEGIGIFVNAVTIVVTVVVTVVTVVIVDVSNDDTDVYITVDVFTDSRESSLLMSAEVSDGDWKVFTIIYGTDLK